MSAKGVSARPPGCGWISRDRVIEAGLTSPRHFLERWHPVVLVERGGAALIVPKVLRADRKDGRWLSCNWIGGGIGDNIALVRAHLGCSFADAVAEILAGPVSAITGHLAAPVLEERARSPRLPGGGIKADGRAYLASRGIALAAIEAAERCGAIVHVPMAIAFVGRDNGGAVRAASLRAIYADYGAARLPKRDLRGTDKRFPAIFPGDHNRVVVVEGGVSGLAVQTLALLSGRPAPLTIVTGGVGVHRWVIENERVSSLLLAASSVTLAGENELNEHGEPDFEKQETTDRQRARLLQLMAERTSGRVELVRPPADCGDTADWLAAKLARSPQQK